MGSMSASGVDAEGAISPEILSIQDLDAIVEASDPTTAAVQYTTFHLFTSNDVVFFGKIPKAKAEISVEDYTAALERVPDRTIFPDVADETELTVASDDIHKQQYIKRPDMSVYELFDDDDDFLARLLLTEAAIMEQIGRQPHPNIVRYYGARVRRGRITRLVLEKHQNTLLEHIKRGVDLDKETFLEALESAVAHPHNDINPENVMVSADKTPVLIDFGS